MSRKLTDQWIRGATARRRVNFADGSCPGLQLRVTPGGVKTFAVSYWTRGGERKTLTLGRWPEVSLADARERTREVRARVRLGEDPVPRPEPVGVTLRALVEAYVKARSPRLGEKTLRGHQGYVRRLGDLGDLPAREVRRHDVEAFLAEVAEDAPVTSNRLLRVIRSAYVWGLGGELVDRNPTLGLAFLPEEGTHRPLSDAELRRLWTCEAEPGLLAFVRVLVLTGTRRTETGLARWGEVSGDSWHVPGENRKGGTRDLDVYLAPLALSVLPPRGEPGAYVFPASVRATPDRAVKALRLASGISDIRFHDLRVTFATGLARLGTPPYVVASALDHSGESIAKAGLAPAVTAVYDRARREPEVRSAVTAWAAHVEKLVGA
jgi:integrase